MIFNNTDLIGYNTDYRAAMDCIEETFQIKRDADAPMAGKAALVLGAGGVSRAIAWGLIKRRCEVTIASRTHQRAQEMATQLGCRCVEWEHRHDVRTHLIINGTPVGMHPHVNDSPYDEKKLNEYMTVFDTVYNPENTLLIKSAVRRRARVITGVDMFVRQAAYQFKLFTGREASTDLMRKTIKQATNPVQIR